MFLTHLITLKLLLYTNIFNPPNVHTDFAIDLLLQLTNVECFNYQTLARTLFRIDHIIYDITPEEEARHLQFSPSANIRFASWDDQKCLNYTSFRRDDLRRIYKLFDLENQCDNDGLIRVASGGANQNNTQCYYKLDPEELFLFFMTRFKKGSTILDLVNDTFGGDHNRWYYAWGWMLRYLDDRYENIIGHQGLLRFLDDFPGFFDAIQDYVKRPKVIEYDDGSVFVSPGLTECPRRIFGWIDCSIYRINVPFSGPLGDYKGASRKPRYKITQRAFYSGMKKVHGVKVETVYLPNGLSTVFGPVTCRRRDIAINGGASVADLSGISRFLSCIQRNKYNPSYSVFGDSIYACGLDCICSYYKAIYRSNEMDPFMRICDAEMKGCRESIEWDYGKKGNVFRICKDPDQYKLGKKNPVSYLAFYLLITRRSDVFNVYFYYSMHTRCFELHIWFATFIIALTEICHQVMVNLIVIRLR